MKNKITVFLFIGYIFSFCILHIILKDMDISYSERRGLKDFPVFELTSDYITDLDKYLLDHFPMRDTFRSIKALYNFKILNKLDNNDIYLKDDYIFKSDYPTNEKSINKFIKNAQKIMELFNKNNNVNMLVVPDKNYYIDEKNFLSLDYEYIYDELKNIDVNLIDIRDLMKLEDYYETDTHWKQENLEKVVEVLANNMNFKYVKQEYKSNYFDKFYGVYYGESAMPRKPERLTYLTNDIILNAKVNYLENKDLTTVYNTSNLDSLDAYEVYLDGASSFIEITNDKCDSKKELIIFRDSFGSSLTPLLIPYYSKITVIDNRYITIDMFKELIEFKNQDILFVYSTLIINNSSSLKG